MAVFLKSWDVDDETGAGARRGVGRDGAAVALDDPAAEREPDTGASVHIVPVQALEWLEDALGVLRVEADAVVGDDDLPAGAGRRRQGRPLVMTRGGADPNERRRRAAEFQGVDDQVLEQLSHLGRIGWHRGQ